MANRREKCMFVNNTFINFIHIFKHKMYIHHALPKDLLPTPKRPSYEIKKKFSPMHRDHQLRIK